jgi:hypothetical protein
MQLAIGQYGHRVASYLDSLLARGDIHRRGEGVRLDPRTRRCRLRKNLDRIVSGLRCFHRENFAGERSLEDVIFSATPPVQSENKLR